MRIINSVILSILKNRIIMIFDYESKLFNAVSRLKKLYVENMIE